MPPSAHIELIDIPQESAVAQESVGRPWILIAGEWARRLFAVPTDAHAIVALDGVRALAASLVFLVHYQAAFGYLLGARPLVYHIGEYVANVGVNGVNVFFVLSGFLIYGSLLGRPVTPSRYLKRRARRIYPTFLVVLGIYLLLSALFPERSKLPAGPGALLFIGANALLLPGVFPIRPIVTVSWSLSYELCFYGLILAVVVGLRLRSWPVANRVWFWLMLVMVWVIGGTTAQSYVSSFILFVPGILLAEAFRSEAVRAWAVRIPIALLGSIFTLALVAQPALVTVVHGPWLGRVPLITGSVIGVLLLATATPLFVLRLMLAPPATTRFAREPVRRLGVVSYSFYLCHGLVINGIAELCARPLIDRRIHPLGTFAYIAFLPGVFCAATLGAFVLFRTVEQPLSLTRS